MKVISLVVRDRSHLESVHEIQLEELPEDILIEIIARVSLVTVKRTRRYTLTSTEWTNLKLVNRQFNNIVITKSAQMRAVELQYNLLYQLLPRKQLEENPIMFCKRLLHRFALTMPWPSKDGSVAEQVVELGVVLFHTLIVYVDHVNGTALAVTSNNAPRRYELWRIRVQLFYLRLLRLLPTEFSLLLRYCALRMYEHHRLKEGPAAFLVAQPESIIRDARPNPYLTVQPQPFRSAARLFGQVQMFLDFEEGLSSGGPSSRCLRPALLPYIIKLQITGSRGPSTTRSNCLFGTYGQLSSQCVHGSLSNGASEWYTGR